MNQELPANNNEYWSDLDPHIGTQQYGEHVQHELQAGPLDMSDPVTRRKFLAMMGASMALAGMASCRRPVEHIVPYVAPPEEVIPGVPRYYATAMPLGTGAFGVVVESHEGRPTKIEGNKGHPSTPGMSNRFIQASILNMYDPNRSRKILHNGDPGEWTDFVAIWRELYSSFLAGKGAGLAVLIESHCSPTQARVGELFLKTFPQALMVTYDAVSDENIYEGLRVALGKPFRPIYHFDKAGVVLSLDSDFAFMESENIANARNFIAGRRVESEKDQMNRLYAVESVFSVTGAMADHRLRVQSGQVGVFAAALVRELISQGLPINDGGALSAYATESFDRDWIRALATDLLAAKGKSLLVAGRRQPPSVHALTAVVNSALGNLGNTIEYQELQDIGLPNREAFSSLVSDMQTGRISALVILEGNPAYNAPSDLDFAGALKKVPHAIHLSPHVDETSRLAEWHLPAAHYLEYWGDARAYDGSLSIIQPLIQPLFGGHSPIEILNLLATGVYTPGYDLVRSTWQRYLKASDFEMEWRHVLNDGLLKDSAQPSAKVTVDSAFVFDYLIAHPFAAAPATADNLELVFCVSAALYDGRYANNAWLQELPDPTTQLDWDNVAMMSPKTAQELNLKNEDVIRLQFRGHEVSLPAWIMPGMADYSVAVALGYGRGAAGAVANGVGVDVYPLRMSGTPDFASDLKVIKTGETHDLASTQTFDSMAGRPIIREATLDYYRQNPRFAPLMVEHQPLESLYKQRSYDTGYQWGMAIDLNACIGCGTCTIACQSENNIVTVGKKLIRRGRKMHWIRVDRYFEGDRDNPKMLHQPVPCQQCENAPCEEVCPVGATSHGKEGLNVMVYNRCIGTRYCSNNCPYKVRRFNFSSYTGHVPEILRMAENPDVTVRSRGVMEKCSYCLQRINRAKIEAKKEGRQIRDGEITPACAQSCPTGAIVFGDILDPESRVAKLKTRNRNYQMLIEYNTRPRTSYLAKIWNPNSHLEELGKSRI